MTYHLRGENGERWLVWEGIEAEGSLKGKSTLFVGDIPLGEAYSILSPYFGCYEHLYINPVFITNGNSAMSIVNDMAEHFDYVTVSLTPELMSLFPERNALRENIRIALVLDVYGSSLQHLRPNDTIRLQIGRVENGDLRNYTIDAGDVQLTEIAIYDLDKPILKGD